MDPKFISETIINQLSAGRPGLLIRMIGAKKFIALPITEKYEGGLYFKFMRGNQSINQIKINLTWSDVYTVEFINIRGRVVEILEDIYCDQLRDIFQSVTGLTLAFPTVIFKDIPRDQWTNPQGA